jgi:hypothetical protein
MAARGVIRSLAGRGGHDGRSVSFGAGCGMRWDYRPAIDAQQTDAAIAQRQTPPNRAARGRELLWVTGLEKHRVSAAKPVSPSDRLPPVGDVLIDELDARTVGYLGD